MQLFDASMLQQLIHAAGRKLLLAAAEQAPTILILEDLHWSDSASWNFLHYFLPSARHVPLLLLLVSRDSHRIEPATPHNEIHLGALTLEEGRLMVDQLIRQTTAEAQFVKTEIAQLTAGNPFYADGHDDFPEFQERFGIGPGCTAPAPF